MRIVIPWRLKSRAGPKIKLYGSDQSPDCARVLSLPRTISGQEAGKLIRRVTEHHHCKRRTKKHVTRGPVAAISTSTKNRLKPDDDNRHISLKSDTTAKQTREIIKDYMKSRGDLSCAERKTWHTAQHLLEKRGKIPIVFPEWFDGVAEGLFIEDLRVRRYYPAFVEACRTVCLIRSFQRDQEPFPREILEVDFADFAITAIIFDPVFVQSLQLGSASSEGTRKLVEQISARTGRPVEAKDVAHEFKISMAKAYGKLRHAQQQGIVRQVNEPERNNRKA